MKYIKLLSAVAFFVLICAQSMAETKKPGALEEMLKAQQAEIDQLKGEINELKVSKEKKGEGGYDKGFFIRTTDGDFELKFRWFAQPFYEYDINEDAPDASTFGIRRSRFLLSGNAFNKNLTYMAMTEMVTTYTVTSTVYTDSGGDQVIIRDANDLNWRLLYLWAQYRFANEFQLRVGEFIPPTERFFLASNLQEFQNFPMIAIAEPFTPNFQLGAMIFGTIKNKLTYEAFCVNGTGLDRLNINKAFLTGLRLTYAALGKSDLSTADLDYSEKPVLQFAAHASYDKADGNVALRGGKGDNVFRTSADIVFKYKGFSLVPEFILFYNNMQHLKDYAFAAQTGYFITPHHLELAAQANYLRYEGPANDQYEFSAGLNYYFYGQPVKLQADYSYLISRQPGDDANNHRIRIGMQMGFF